MNRAFNTASTFCPIKMKRYPNIRQLLAAICHNNSKHLKVWLIHNSPCFYPKLLRKQNTEGGRNVLYKTCWFAGCHLKQFKLMSRRKEIQYEQISPVMLVPEAFSSVGSTRGMWEELTTCCDLCGLSCEPPQSHTAPRTWENNTESACTRKKEEKKKKVHFVEWTSLLCCDGYFSGVQPFCEVQMWRNTDG